MSGPAGPVVFLQRRAHRAGAQTCLLRLLRHPAMRALEPVLVCGEEGWLTAAARDEGIACIVEPFPSSRSLGARLFGNSAFARRVAARLPCAPALVHGNDHLEGLLTLALAERLGVPAALFLRSPTMSAADFRKYRCARADLLAAVGPELQRFDSRTRLVPDGLEPGEFLAPKPVPAVFPRRILVIGSAVEWKGWGDALRLLAELQSSGPPLEADFTGTDPGLPRPVGMQARFLGRVERFRDLVRGYDLVLNPTWHESFGMAALEVLAAGVPLFSTRSGVIEQVVDDERWLARPRDVEEMAAKLRLLARAWPGSALDVAACQTRIRERFLIERSVGKLLAAYRPLLGGKNGTESGANAGVA